MLRANARFTSTAMVSTRGQDAIGFFPLLVALAQLPGDTDILLQDQLAMATTMTVPHVVSRMFAAGYAGV